MELTCRDALAACAVTVRNRIASIDEFLEHQFASDFLFPKELN